jgi:hypothetical protein
LTSRGKFGPAASPDFVVEDETCSYLFDAESSDRVVESARRALQFERVAEGSPTEKEI